MASPGRVNVSGLVPLVDLGWKHLCFCDSFEGWLLQLGDCQMEATCNQSMWHRLRHDEQFVPERAMQFLPPFSLPSLCLELVFTNYLPWGKSCHIEQWKAASASCELWMRAGLPASFFGFAGSMAGCRSSYLIIPVGKKNETYSLVW